MSKTATTRRPAAPDVAATLPPNPFNWQASGADQRPLNADIKPTPPPPRKGGRPPSGKAFGSENSTIKQMATARTERILAARPSINQVRIAKRVERHRTRTYDGNFVSVVVGS